MAIDLVGSVSQFLTPQRVGSLARVRRHQRSGGAEAGQRYDSGGSRCTRTTAAAPGGAQKLVDAVSNSDPDLLAKLAAAIGGGKVNALNEGANLAPSPARRLGLVEPSRRLEPILRRYPGRGAVGDRRCRAMGDRRDRPAGSVQLVRRLFDRCDIRRSERRDCRRASQRSFAGPRRDRTTGGLGGPPAAAHTARPTVDGSKGGTATASSSAAASRTQVASGSSGFPTWAIILLIVIVLAAIWWFMSRNQKAEPAKTGTLRAPIEFALTALTPPAAEKGCEARA